MSEDDEILDSLDPAAPADYRALAVRLAFAYRDRPAPLRIGLAGGQGAGKSTLAALLAAAFEALGQRTCVVALDDYYRTRAERQALARSVHPLLETRGPPGTHDVAKLTADLIDLAKTRSVVLPRFDKGLDDRVGTRRVDGPFARIVLEGWCVGARSVGPDALVEPCNALEAEFDADGHWRRAIDAALARDYEPLWERLDVLVFLAAPDLASIRRWRLQQEQALEPERRRDAAAIDRFVAYFERVTRAMAETLPQRADWVVELAADHSVARISCRGS